MPSQGRGRRRRVISGGQRSQLSPTVDTSSQESRPSTEQTHTSQTPGTSSSCVRVKRGSGPAKAKYLVNLDDGKTIDVEIMSGRGVGPNGHSFTSYLGILGKLHCRIWQKDFRKLSSEIKDAIFRDLMQYFTFSRSEEIDNQILRKIGDQHRKRRWNLKQKYFENLSFEEAIKNVPPEIDAAEWRRMCELWITEEDKDPRFQPDLSRTYQPVKCNINCTCDDEKNQCTYERQYAEMSTSSGVLGEDLLSFGKESALEAQRAIFGCENVETGNLYSQHADGIMGLSRGQPSIVDQLVDKGVIADSFSLCYGGMDVGGGAMVLGGISPPPEMVFSHSDPLRSPYYNIELKGIYISGKLLQLNPSVFDSKHGTVLDSGTTYAYLPEAAFVVFRDAIMKQLHSLKQIDGPDPNYKDICFSGAGSDVSELSKTFPEVDMVFSNGQKLSLSPENYLFRHSKVQGAYCLGVFQNGNDPTTLLGGIIVRNTLVMYDRENRRIGFWKTNCLQLWERLHFHGAPLAPSPAPSPVPSASHIGNSTLRSSPALSSSRSPLSSSHSPDIVSDASQMGDQAVACVLMLIALVITYIIH